MPLKCYASASFFSVGEPESSVDSGSDDSYPTSNASSSWYTLPDCPQHVGDYGMASYLDSFPTRPHYLGAPVAEAGAGSSKYDRYSKGTGYTPVEAMGISDCGGPASALDSRNAVGYHGHCVQQPHCDAYRPLQSPQAQAAGKGLQRCAHLQGMAGFSGASPPAGEHRVRANAATRRAAPPRNCSGNADRFGSDCCDDARATSEIPTLLGFSWQAQPKAPDFGLGPPRHACYAVKPRQPCAAGEELSGLEKRSPVAPSALPGPQPGGDFVMNTMPDVFPAGTIRRGASGVYDQRAATLAPTELSGLCHAARKTAPGSPVQVREGFTTVKFSQMPSRVKPCDVEEIVARLGFERQCDFIWLPRKSRRNYGFAFVNFTTEQDALDFSREFDKYQSTPPGPRREHSWKISVAEVQGKKEIWGMMLEACLFSSP